MKYFYCYKVNGKYWAYDRYSNLIAEVDEPTFNIIKTYDDHHFDHNSVIRKLNPLYKPELINKKLENLKKFQKENNAFLPFDLSESVLPYSSEELKQKYEKEMRHVIFNITDDCNLRCRYCKYSGTYKGVRTHRKNSMSYSTINKSLKLIQKLYKGKDTLIVGFYGGEPLLEFDKIRYVISNIRKQFNDVRCSLSTNGTLIDRYFLEFAIKNNIMIKFSLNGPQEIHNRERITKTGKGTFDIIFRNLKNIKELNIDYFKNYIGFIITITPPYDLFEIFNFYNEISETTQPVIFSYIDPFDTTYFENFNMIRENKKLNLQLKNLSEKYTSLKIKNDKSLLSKLLDDYYGKAMLTLDQRKIFSIRSTKIFPNGTCLPGLDRLFISTDGNLGMCEKVNESLIIGDVENGFDLRKIKKITDDYCKIVNKVCLDCWAYRLCSSCYLSALKENKLDEVRKREDCQRRKTSIINNLKLYTKIKMANPEAFKGSVVSK